VNTNWLQTLHEHLRYLGKAYLVLLLALCLTAGGLYFSRLSYTNSQIERFGDIADDIDNLLQRRIDSYTNVLGGVAGLYRASVSVERSEFRSYLMATELTDRPPGIQGIGFARLVPDDAMERFVTQVRNDTSLQPGGYPQFTAHALTGDSTHLIVDYIEPFDTNSAIFGQDMGHDPQRQAALLRARDTGMVCATPPINAWEDASRKTPDVLIILPIYRNGQATDTLAARRAAFSGVVFARLAVVALFDKLSNDSLEQKAHIRIEDMGDAGRPLLIHSSPVIGKLADSNMIDTRTLDVADRHWRLTVHAYADALQFGNTDASPYVAGAGLVISLLLFILTATQARHNALRRQQNIILEHQAAHDSLTGLPNRHYVYRELGRLLVTGNPSNHLLAVLLIDLNGFKDINDTLGHHSGDQLLRMIGPRLQAVLRGDDCLARLGGDEFALLMCSPSSLKEMIQSIEAVQAIFRQPFEVEGLKLRIGASIGVAMYPEHGGDVSTLMRHADIAMYVAKNRVQGYAIYDPAHDSHSPQQLALLTELGDALRNNQLVLHYQPIITTRGGAIGGVEALLRWQHPQRGLLPPGEFIAQAERSELIKPMTLWVLDTALAQCMTWRRAGIGINVAVNISARNLQDSELPEQVLALCRRHGATPGCLTLEITESAIVTDPVRALDTLTTLTRSGVTIAIDDFGTGYTSLGYLKNLSARHVKIDRSFVTEMTHDENDAVIVRSIIDLAHNLGMTVVAEGVENRDVHDILEILGCDQLQGYYYGKPMPVDALNDWLAMHGPQYRLPQRSTLHALR
jgi:diguanylate cyclase (GGDEF)-like protein